MYSAIPSLTLASVSSPLPKFYQADYTAYFSDNDPREANFTYEGERYGFPLPEAIWRTNHAYDSGITSHRLPSPKPQGDTFNRYMLLHDTFEGYRTGGVAISDLQAVNLTAIVGDKGGSSRSSFLTCDHAAQGENIISATFVPSVHGTGGAGWCVEVVFCTGCSPWVGHPVSSIAPHSLASLLQAMASCTLRLRTGTTRRTSRRAATTT